MKYHLFLQVNRVLKALKVLKVLKVFRVLKVLKVRQDLMEMVEKEMQVLHFFSYLNGTPTRWSEPPTLNVKTTSDNGPYVTIDGAIDNTPNLNYFEFLRPGSHSELVINHANRCFPNQPYVADADTSKLTTPTGIKLPLAGPRGLESVVGHNCFYGYRLPKDATLLGFTVDFMEQPNTGVFQVFYYGPVSCRSRSRPSTCCFCTISNCNGW